MKNLVKINDEKLKKYQDLFFWAGKVAGRLILKNKGTHGNLVTAVSLFEQHYANSDFGFHNPENRQTPLAPLIELLIEKNLDEWDIYESCKQFFYDVVFDVARKEKLNIKYNWIIGEHCLYGTNMNGELRDGSYSNYLSYLLKNGFTGEDLKNSIVIVDYKNYEY
ncbi:MAG: hypothetical protein PHI38_06870 [Sulfurimonas sp.]|uniref:hypothetical protein n=1 Tax=Sulfurimonas sp. TaxID=2022749 RepID=UPI002625BE9D|nr:hypothetical protein [Sulfurimonas sp.]MDD3476574.1 hypothetical protein [Sulfurimonas sp.]